MAGTEIKREWMVSLPDHSDLDNIQDIEFKSDGSIVASFYSGPFSTGNKTTTYHIAADGNLESQTTDFRSSLWSGGGLRSSEGNTLRGVNIVSGNVQFSVFSIADDGASNTILAYNTGKNSWCNSVAIDKIGNIIIGGTETSFPASNYLGLLQKWDSAGNIIWSVNASTFKKNPGYQYSIQDVEVDESGSIYAYGYAQNPRSNYLQKYRDNGELEWELSIGGDDFIGGVELASNGTIYALNSTGTLVNANPNGTFNWEIDVGPGISDIQVTNSTCYAIGVNGNKVNIIAVSENGGITPAGTVSFSEEFVISDFEIHYDNTILLAGRLAGDGFVARYSLDSIKRENTPPEGTPTLSGNFKLGQVITIDKTPIQDADNFTGYTPDFKYTWEIANDPGMTMMIPVWESLNTADATDGDETFTITADLTGKLIRGVVSYLDGYGTQESVASTASAPITSSAPPVQSLTLIAPSKSTIRSGVNTTSAIAYNVSTGETNLTGVGASLYFDSTQLTVTTAGDPFNAGLLGSAIIADTSNADGDPKTDKVLALTYADFGGNFPGSGTTLPLTLANLNLVPTASYTGTTLHLKGSPASGYTATGADLTLGYNASPVVNSTLPALTTNRGSAFSYTYRSDLFTDPDSTLTLSATTATGASLPSWLSFNASTRTLSGTPTTGGTLNINLSASDELGSVSTPLSIKVREVQQLSSSASTIRYQRDKDVTLPINYSTTDGSSSTGLAFKVHFNSSLFTFDPTTGVSNKLASAGLFEVGSVQQDTGDSDNDPTTDQYIPISLASFTGQLPSGSKLADLTFRTADKAIDPLTGLKDTSINFSETSVASGYGFSGTSATLKPLSFNLDVDGDGLVTPLGDGLMVIRYLFGNAFAGDALINKAISPDSPLLGGKSYTSMSATEKAGVASLVATNIQQGIDSKLLDVDGDGKTTPLGDGLMVIRRLFGNAFAGSALTSKAISPESPYFSDPNAHLIVASNIDALKPTPTVI